MKEQDVRNTTRNVVLVNQFAITLQENVAKVLHTHTSPRLTSTACCIERSVVRHRRRMRPASKHRAASPLEPPRNLTRRWGPDCACAQHINDRPDQNILHNVRGDDGMRASTQPQRQDTLRPTRPPVQQQSEDRVCASSLLQHDSAFLNLGKPQGQGQRQRN